MGRFGSLHRQRGQVIVITAMVILLLVGFLSLIIDAGLAYADRREHQNGVDNGALAGARLIVKVPPETSSTNVLKEISDYVGQNGGTVTSVEYLDASRNPIGTLMPGSTVPNDARGVLVRSQAPMNTIFARVFGTTQMDVGAVGAAIGGPAGLPAGGTLTPLAIPVDALTDPATPDLYWGSQYTKFQDLYNAHHDPDIPDNFKGIVDLHETPECPQNATPQRTECFIENGFSGPFESEVQPINTGEYGSQVRDELEEKVVPPPADGGIIYVLVFDQYIDKNAGDPECDAINDERQTNGDCLHLVGVAAFRVHSVDITSNKAIGDYIPVFVPYAEFKWEYEDDLNWPRTVRLVEPGVVVPAPPTRTPAPTRTSTPAPTPTSTPVPLPTSTPVPTATPCPAPDISGLTIVTDNSGKKIQANWNTNIPATSRLYWRLGTVETSTDAGGGMTHSANSGNLANGTYDVWVTSTSPCGSPASWPSVPVTINK